MTDDTERAHQIIEINREANERFDEFARILIAEIQLADFNGDETRADALAGIQKNATKNIRKLNTDVRKVIKSTAVVEDVVSGLRGVAEEADEELKKLKSFGESLDKIKQGADIIVRAVQTVAKFA